MADILDLDTLDDSDVDIEATVPKRRPIRQRKDSPMAKKQRESKALAQHSSESREHYTPGDVMTAVRWLMGDIDLDPASTELANTVIQAKTWYGIEHDGLAQPWGGKVWLNPPGGDTTKVRPELKDLSRSYPCIWWARLVHDYLSGAVEQACFMVFQLNLLQSVQKMPNLSRTFFDFPLVVFSDRIQYLYPLDTENGLPVPGTTMRPGQGPPGGSAMVWLPPKEDLAQSRFRQVFSKFGAVLNV